MGKEVILLCLFGFVVFSQALVVANNETLRFIMLGDWGLPIPRPAKNMAKMAEYYNTDFVLALGDNFYYEGVKSTSDKQWKKTFEDVFTQPIFQTRWYVVEGNHDHVGNVTAQVDYTYCCSKRWYLPSLYYTEIFVLPDSQNTTVQFVFIDTIILAGLWYDGEEQPRGPEVVNDADEEWKWIEQTLANSTADWLFVVGHYPVFSIGEHGPTKVLVNQLLPLMEKYQVAAYLNGHDHGMQYLTSNGIQFFVTGAGAKSHVQGAHPLPNVSKFAWPTSIIKELECHLNNFEACYGFSILEISATNATVHMYSSNTNALLFQHTFTNPRAQN